MPSSTFLVTPANNLAFRAVEACVKGDPQFRHVLLCGRLGSGKSALVRWAQARAHSGPEAIEWQDPLHLPLPEKLTGVSRLVATLDDAYPEAGEVRAAFRIAGGHVISMVMETELVEALAREAALEGATPFDLELLSHLVERLKTPASVRGAIARLRAEAALAGVNQIDLLFALRVLGPFLYAPR